MNTTNLERPRVALYLRVSTEDQTNDNQRAALVQLARARGYEIVDVFEEKASGAKTDRVELQRMKVAAHAGAFKYLLIAAIDRLGRSMIGNVQTVMDLDRVGVETVSLREPWLQLAGPVRDLLLAIFSWLAAEERRQISERSRAGVARARREGKVIGRPRVTVDLDQALALRKRGLSIRKAARKLGVGASTLARAYESYDLLQKSCTSSTPVDVPPGGSDLADLRTTDRAASAAE